MDRRRSLGAVTLSTHVLDTTRGLPAAGIAIALYVLAGEDRTLLAQATTNDDGRTDGPLHADLPAGCYEIVFAAGPYFSRQGLTAFYTDIPVRFTLGAAGGRFHVPLLLSPWGYSTYRGS